MKTIELPTQAQIKEVLHYDPVTGVFRWRFSRAKSKVKPWDVAGTSISGYWQIGINNRRYYAHRLAWVYMTGEFPENQLDHIDGNGLNNAWVNLRKATNKQNSENQPLRKNNTSGFRGVTWDCSKSKWLARIQHNYKMVHCGRFDKLEEAIAAASAKRAKFYTHDTGRDALNETKGKR